MSDDPNKCKIDLSEKSLACGSNVVFNPSKHCILCGKCATKKLKLTSTENGRENLRQVRQILELNILPNCSYCCKYSVQESRFIQSVSCKFVLSF